MGQRNLAEIIRQEQRIRLVPHEFQRNNSDSRTGHKVTSLRSGIAFHQDEFVTALADAESAPPFVLFKDVADTGAAASVEMLRKSLVTACSVSPISVTSRTFAAPELKRIRRTVQPCGR
jgi:hypothetical protein